MLSAAQFVQALTREEFAFFTGVPCSFFHSVINQFEQEPSLRYVIAPNEGVALSFASGAHLAGRRAVVLIQNSGFGNLLNPLTSLTMIHRLPILLVVSGRGYGIPDEPQHAIMGKTMTAIFDAIGLRYQEAPQDPAAFESAFPEIAHRMEQERLPFVLIVRKETFEPATGQSSPLAAHPLSRQEALRLVMETLDGNAAVIATTGWTSRELLGISDRAENFYLQGAMGHAAAVGLGVALQRPNRNVVILDGDGSLLMHLGVLSSIGSCRPSNLCHIVFDNASYESTGGQSTTSPTTDFCQIALSCGYRAAQEAVTAEEVRERLKTSLNAGGPALLRIRINRLPSAHLPRISRALSPEDLTERFRTGLSEPIS